ncbi:hypothetical protein BS47DRAFT_1143588 [Hydnum rufescens UP504]|uniref:Protein kinase domain-containing protein n=1 Tax=Hydnum rufescens UP504 TaxID=1448309 RepID=A0A9P6DS13_9AGAM|nr:hypothetical protein BS47DRAFT_1143588 [Hydnum rufescens UP504]
MASTDESDPSAPPLAPNLTREISRMERTVVARGGYSIVYRAEWRPPSGPSQPVVVKVLIVSTTANDNTKVLKRLKREIRVWTRLSHPNIVPLLGFIDEPHGPGMVSPFFAEGTALQFLKKYPDANREVLCLDVARGLQYLHSQKPPIIHGDIKGINVLISPMAMPVCVTSDYL